MSNPGALAYKYKKHCFFGISKIAMSVLVYMMFANSALAASTRTYICIKNQTTQSHKIKVTDIRNYDWDGDSRPDHNFNNIDIPGGATICNREEINAFKSAKFTFLVDDNPTIMQFLYTEEEVIEDGKFPTKVYTNPKWGAYLAEDNPTALYGRETVWFEPLNWFYGFDCSNGSPCYLFEIR